MIDLVELKNLLMVAEKEYDFDNPKAPANARVADRLVRMVDGRAEQALEIICACLYFSKLLTNRGGVPKVDPNDPEDYYSLKAEGKTGPRLFVLQIYTAYLNGDEETAYALAVAAVNQRGMALETVGHAVGFTVRVMRDDWYYVEDDDADGDEKTVGEYMEGD